MSLSILILAAGSAARMRGGDKLLEDVRGMPLLRLTTQRALSACEAVFVALSPSPTFNSRRAALQGLQVTLVDVPRPELGMAHSIAAGVAALPKTCSGVVLLPGDMPEIDEQDLSIFRKAFQDDPKVILRAMTADGIPGHPVGFPAWTFPELLQITGDQGARSVLAAHRHAVRTLALPEEHAVTDLDTPEDWAAWRAKQMQTGR